MKKINFILVDGLGSKNIENLDNILTQNQTDEIVSTFPSSTSVALGSVNLGSDPIENGLIGYYHFDKSENKLINTLNWRGSENYLQDKNFFSNQKTIWNILNEKNIVFNVIQPKNLIDTSLSKHLYRGANQIGYESLDELGEIFTLPNILDNQFNFLYYPVIDVAAHVYGTNSEEWLIEVKKFSEFLSEITKNDVGRYTCLTADHGVINVDDKNRHKIIYDDSVKIYGDQRSVYINGDRKKIKNIFKNIPGHFLEKQEIESLIGFPNDDERNNFFPEHVFLLDDGHIIFPNHLSANLRGYHGGLSPTEVAIPLIEIVS
jgi:predicted AlkP superfamily pyrophosphatase or phosphodiesterase